MKNLVEVVDRPTLRALAEPLIRLGPNALPYDETSMRAALIAETLRIGLFELYHGPDIRSPVHPLILRSWVRHKLGPVIPNILEEGAGSPSAKSCLRGGAPTSEFLGDALVLGGGYLCPAPTRLVQVGATSHLLVSGVPSRTPLGRSESTWFTAPSGDASRGLQRRGANAWSPSADSRGISWRPETGPATRDVDCPIASPEATRLGSRGRAGKPTRAARRSVSAAPRHRMDSSGRIPMTNGFGNSRRWTSTVPSSALGRNLCPRSSTITGSPLALAPPQRASLYRTLNGNKSALPSTCSQGGRGKQHSFETPNARVSSYPWVSRRSRPCIARCTLSALDSRDGDRGGSVGGAFRRARGHRAPP